jgi:hypothetical protein
MPPKLTKNLIKEKIKCDSCKIYIGVNYITHDLKNVGNKAICLACYEYLNSTGYLYIEEGNNKHTVMFPDGSTKVLTTAQFERLKDKLYKIYPARVPKKFKLS